MACQKCEKACTCRLKVRDTNTVDLSISGSGSSSSPWVVSGEVIVAPHGTEPFGVNGPNALHEVNGGLQVCLGPCMTLDGDCLTVKIAQADICGGPNFLTCSQPEHANGGLCVFPSADDGNIVRQGDDGGIYVNADDVTSINTADTDCIQLLGNGDATPLSAVPVISAEAGNTLVCRTAADGNPGLFAAGGAGGSLVEVDTQSVDLTTTDDGLGNFTIQADVLTGCGLDVDATGVHVVANGTWPYACDQDANAQAVMCSPATGELQVEHPVRCAHGSVDRQATVINCINPPTCDGSFMEVVPQSVRLIVNNPDPCRDMVFNVEAYSRLRLTMCKDLGGDAANTNLQVRSVIRVNGVPAIEQRAQHFESDTSGCLGCGTETKDWPDRDTVPAAVVVPFGAAIFESGVDYECSPGSNAGFVLHANAAGFQATGVSCV